MSIEVRSPADGSVVGVVKDQRPDEVAETVNQLREHQTSWEGGGFAERARWLRRYRDWLLDNEDTIARILQSETGKPWAEATMEVPYAADVINYYAKHGERFLTDETPKAHGPMTLTKRQRAVHRPYPVVGVITPWNFPVALSLMDAIPALLAGAAVVVKPSEFTPLATSTAIAGWAESGAPPVLTCLTGYGDTGAALVDTVDYVQFTGSTRTGTAIATRAAERLIPYGLELGGKDPMLVLSDADLDRAANAAVWGGICNSGQMCTSVERIYVEAPVYEDFVNRVVERVRELRQGTDGADTDGFRYDVGALANQAQVEIVRRHVDEAIAAGAKALIGGKATGTGTFFEPTVLVDVDHSMACMREETFGPTLPIMKVTDADEAVRLANDTPYGLSATVFSRDTERGERIARRLEAGAVNVNDVFTNLFALPLPMAGWKQSGMGARNGGPHGIRKYCRTQAIVSSRVAPRAEPMWYPYRPLRGNLLRRVTRFVMARDLKRRLGLR
ncbi:aldehyde dehydrogenase family protein [Haloechinothrix salitolerans]|uniref:Aldehyde dehydrogenase n=1 Tax=Haloechinothrix salitolerans TaxID=926830 RepID=A0ABW2C7J5_9PSEU